MFTSEIKKSLFKALRALSLDISEEKIILEHPADVSYGDYSTNIALKLKNSKETAETVVKKWQEIGLPEFVEKVEVAGAGFINIWLNFEALSRQLMEVLNAGNSFGQGKMGEGKTVVVDYSAPNIAKPFGIGHLRSTNIGQAIYNTYKAVGFKTIGDNHLGDWGTQFGKLIYKILEIKDKKKLSELSIEDLEKLYVEFHKEAEEKPEMEEEARKLFKKLEEGDKEVKEIWQICADVSLEEFNRIYDLLGVKIDFALGESFFQDKMGAVLQDCRKKGILKESQGAQVVEILGMEIPAMLVKSDGATTYLLRDLATIKYRVAEWQADLIIYEVGVDQTFHFKQLFNIATQLGYGKPEMFVHVGHGLIRWPTGKFSTRKGDTVHLEDVLTEAIERAAAFVPPGETSASQRINIARAVGIGAIKYNDLKQNPRTDIVFDWDQVLSLQGNSGPYLQYSFARTQSVLRKAKDLNLKFLIFNFKSISNVKILNVSNEEISLLRTIYRFPEAIADAAREFSPNLVCNFLFDLAQKFNLFYDKERIIGNENEEFRLLLTSAVGQVLKNGLTLLGIEALEKM
ncbi:arginine--tRNA ligase [Candidatus Shapirobacteria bacterium CG09_land_8_20_14_0_10_39_12]|uniref:Arginine--tRNA ligase n=1 Tax=Candidatus Shapirobacteria bacterium CG09_land_8_20_14_0_10_39_12 TaxID=1974885 RepID=A0A2H0WPN7_9BACT|nr:MAG: arginine--tRNA ligase [Candidatus Shapirobacteria bacterium CG09_land_8_20_14_0_10_39_12]